MAFVYLVPVIGDGTKADPRRPKYFAGAIGDWSVIDGNAMMLVISDTISQADHDRIVAQSDVISLDLSQIDTNIATGLRQAINTRIGTSMTGNTIMRIALRQVINRLQVALTDVTRITLHGEDI